VRDRRRLDDGQRPRPLESRTDVQGLTDLVMNLVAAGAGGASGLVVAWWGYPTLSLLTCLLPAAVGGAAYVAARQVNSVAAGSSVV